MKKLLLPLFASFLMVYSSQGQQTTPSPRDPAAASDSTEADNTKRNSSEQNKNTDTAEKQSNSGDDLALTQKLRQAVMKDGSLSMNAKNVKIIAQDKSRKIGAVLQVVDDYPIDLHSERSQYVC
jgi:hypothetical protein